MAEPANRLVLEVVRNDCSSVTCPYRYGDESHNQRLLDKLDKKLRYRVADGNEVRELKKRVGELEITLLRAIEVVEKRKLNPQEIERLRAILHRSKKPT